MELKRIAAEILSIREQMDALIERHGRSWNPLRTHYLARKLLELKSRCDDLIEQV